MEGAKEQMDQIRGNPVTVTIGGKPVTVEQMTIDTQLEVMDGWVTMGGDESDEASSVKKPVKFMCWIVSKAIGISLEELNKSANLAEIFEAFPKIWEQNGLGFLFKRAGKAMAALRQASDVEA